MDQLNFNFLYSFVPTYSALNRPEPTTQNQMFQNFTVPQAPFSFVYGDGFNDEHISVWRDAEAWRTLFREQFGVQSNGTTNCTSLAVNPPPLPVFSNPQNVCYNIESGVPLSVNDPVCIATRGACSRRATPIPTQPALP
jgi:hypothetical protein